MISPAVPLLVIRVAGFGSAFAVSRFRCRFPLRLRVSGLTQTTVGGLSQLLLVVVDVELVRLLVDCPLLRARLLLNSDYPLR